MKDRRSVVFFFNSLRPTSICKTRALSVHTCIPCAAASSSDNCAMIVQCQNWESGVDTIVFNSVTDLPGISAAFLYKRVHMHVLMCVCIAPRYFIARVDSVT